MITAPKITDLLAEIAAKGRGYRSGTLARATDEQGKEIEDSYELSFSSEEPYERWFGVEVLGHKKEEVEMGWLESGSAPLLLQHNPAEQIGVVDKAYLRDRRGKAVARFGKSARAREILADVAAGVRKNVSVGYEVLDMVLVKEPKNGPAEYRVTRWKPVEVSIVSVPADTTVGVGRSPEPTPITTRQEKTMTPLVEETTAADIKKAEQKAAAAAVETERTRTKEIRTLSRAHGMAEFGEEHIDKNTDLESFRRELLGEIALKSAKPGHVLLGTPKQGVHTGGAVGGLSKADRKAILRYSFLRAIHAAANGKPLDGVEREMHEHGERVAAAMGMETKGISVPFEVLTRADLTVADDGTNLVQTNVGTDFIGALRNRMVLAKLGARFLTGLRGNVKFPKISAGASATWEGENDANAESEPTTASVSLTPKRVGLYSEVSKQLLLQSSPDVELMLRDDLASAIALAIDAAGIKGSGSGGQPTGITATSGIGSVAGGTNGLAPTFAHLVALETAVAIDNADVGKLSYLTNAAVRGKLKGTAKVASTDSRMVWDADNLLNGYGVEISNSVPSDLTKGSSSGVCSAIIFGNFEDLIIGLFGGLDLVVDPYTLATTGLVRLVINAYADVGVRHAESFAAMLDALTA